MAQRTIERNVIGRYKVVPLLSESPRGNLTMKNKGVLLRNDPIRINKDVPVRMSPECVHIKKLPIRGHVPYMSMG